MPGSEKLETRRLFKGRGHSVRDIKLDSLYTDLKMKMVYEYSLYAWSMYELYLLLKGL